MTAEVSIIVPVYQAERDLRRCLDSLVGQTLGAIEIICVDDGSTDGSAAILSGYAARDPRVRVLRQENAGQSAARNAGLAAATGAFVMFCDSDDWAEATWCAELHGAVSACPEADMAVARAFIDGDCAKGRRRELERNQRLRFSGARPSGVGLFPRVDHSVWTKIFRRSMLERHALRFPLGELCEDWSFSYAALAASRSVVFLDRPLYHYVQRAGSTLNGGGNADRIALDFIRQWDRLRRFLVSSGKWPAWRVPMLEYGVRMFGVGGERLRHRACELANDCLRALPREDLEGLPPRLAADLAAVRTHDVHRALCRRWSLGPVTFARRIRDLAGDRLQVLFVRFYTKRY